MTIDPDDARRPLGFVLDEDRGSLPYSLVHGESLVASAAWALGEAGVDPVDATVPWEDVRGAGAALVLHDALCPLTPPAFIADCVAESAETDAVVVGVRPVTDTVKELDDGEVGETVDRDDLLTVASPLVVPAGVVATLADPLPTDLVDAVARLAAAGHVVRRAEAPALARRVASAEDVAVLEALSDQG